LGPIQTPLMKSEHLHFSKDSRSSAFIDARTRFGTALTAIAYNINTPDGWALQKAAAEGHKDIVEELLHRGADVNAHTVNPKFPAGTALQAACEAGKADIVELLLLNKADPDLGPTPDTCPLLAATEAGEERIVELLIKAHANVNVSDKEGCTPLINAAMLLPKDSVALLVEAGAKINSFDDEGNTALISAAEVGDQDTIEYLLAQGADIMHSNNKGLNALQIAVENTNEDCLPPLVNHVSDILSAIKTAMGAGNSAITDVIKGVKFLNQDKIRRRSDTSFFANDDLTLPAPSVRNSEDMAIDDVPVTKSVDMDQPLLEGLNTLFGDTAELEGDEAYDHGQSTNISEADEQSSIGLDFLFNNTSEENGVALERNGSRPKELIRPVGSDFFQKPSLSFMVNEYVQQPRPQSDYTSPVQMKIKRKPPATLTSTEPLLAPLPARSEYGGNPCQQEVSNLPPQQSKPDSTSPKRPSGQSTVSYSPNLSSQRYQPWSSEQKRYNQATPPPPQRTQHPAPSPSTEVQSARMRPFIPYSSQSYVREQSSESISPCNSSLSSLSQSQSQVADQGAYFTENLYNGDGFGDQGGTSENRYVLDHIILDE
jgi:ankyrin repeat protein